MSKLMHELRGFRNNNPGNLEKGDAWDGLVFSLPGVDEEKRFCQFSSIDYGIRAIYRILKTYREKHGLDTIEGIINRWAPSNENNTDSYIKAIEKRTCINRKREIYEFDYPKITFSIIEHENGFVPFDITYIEDIFKWAVPEWHIRKTK